MVIGNRPAGDTSAPGTFTGKREFTLVSDLAHTVFSGLQRNFYAADFWEPDCGFGSGFLSDTVFQQLLLGQNSFESAAEHKPLPVCIINFRGISDFAAGL